MFRHSSNPGSTPTSAQQPSSPDYYYTNHHHQSTPSMGQVVTSVVVEDEDEEATRAEKKNGRPYSVYDAVAGRVLSHRNPLAHKNNRSSNSTAVLRGLRVAVLAPADVLFRGPGAPARWAEDDVYAQHRKLLTSSDSYSSSSAVTSARLLPASDLLKATHAYAADFLFARAAAREDDVQERTWARRIRRRWRDAKRRGDYGDGDDDDDDEGTPQKKSLNPRHAIEIGAQMRSRSEGSKRKASRELDRQLLKKPRGRGREDGDCYEEENEYPGSVSWDGMSIREDDNLHGNDEYDNEGKFSPQGSHGKARNGHKSSHPLANNNNNITKITEKGKTSHRSMDGSALLALGILLEEAAGEVIEGRRDTVLTEGISLTPRSQDRNDDGSATRAMPVGVHNHESLTRLCKTRRVGLDVEEDQEEERVNVLPDLFGLDV